MIILDQILFYEWNLKLTRLLAIKTFAWDTATNLVKVSTATKQNSEEWKREAHFLYVLLLAAQLAHLFRTTSNWANSDLLIALINLLVSALAHLYLRVCLNKAEIVTQYLNGVLTMARSLQPEEAKKRKLNVGEKLNMLLIKFGAVSSIAAGALVAIGLHWKEPCKPCLAGYWLLPECNGLELNWIVSWTAKIIVMLINMTLFWLGIVAAVGFLLGNVQVLATLTLRDLLSHLKVKAEVGTLSDKELSNGYRSVQILELLANEIQQRSTLPQALVICLGVQSVAVVDLIRAPGMDLSTLALAGSMFINAMWFVVLFMSGMAGIYIESKLVHQKDANANADLGQTRKEKTWRRKFMRSCPFIKIRFGDLNFVEELTPLNCLDFGNHITVQLLLLTKKLTTHAQFTVSN